MSTAFRLIGCIPYDTQTVGFYLPLFISTQRDGLYVQRTSVEGETIDDFTRVEDDLADFIDVKAERGASLGEPPLYVFRAETDFFVGHLSELRQLVERQAKHSNRPSLLLQYAELFGTSADKKAARAQVLRNLRNRMVHGQGHTYFTTSLFLHSLRSNVISGLRPEAPRDELASIMHWLLLCSDLNSPHLFPDDLWEKLQPLLTYSRGELRERILSEIPEETMELALPTSSMPRMPLDEQTLAEALQKLRRLGRQEERLAVILDEYITRPEVAEFLLSAHKDRGGLAQDVIKIIRANFGDHKKQSERENFVAKLIRRMFTLSFSLSRGETLYYLARHLGKYDLVARAIRARMHQSRARNVLYLRQSIERALEMSKQESKASVAS